MSNEILALKVHSQDNIAPVFEEVSKGAEVAVVSKDGTRVQLTALEAIPYGHKIAVMDIQVGEHIYKYGESIGVATAQITKGDYVHVHNLDSARGRGDL